MIVWAFGFVSRMNLDILVFIGYVFLVLTIALKQVGRVRSESSYLIANRSAGFFPLLATLVMTEFNTSTLIGFSGIGILAGIWGVWLPSVFLFGLGFYTLVVARKWKAYNGLSTAGYFTKTYGPFLGKTVSGLLLLAMCGFSATYVKSLLLLFQPLFPGSSDWGIGFILIFLTLGFCLRGGLESIIKVDIFGFLSVLVFIPSLLLFAWRFSNPTWSQYLTSYPIQTAKEILPLPFIGSLVVLTMFTYISAPWYSQKIFASKDEDTAFSAVGLASLIVFLLYAFPVVATGVFVLGLDQTITPDQAIPLLILKTFPEGFRGFAYAVLFVTGATTLAGVWSAMTTMVISDFLPTETKSHTLTRSMFLMFCIACCSYVLGITMVPDVLNRLILANIPVAALSFALLGGFYWKGTTKLGVYASIFVGFFWGIFCYLYWGEEGGYTLYWAFCGIPLTFFVGIFLSLAFPKIESEKK